MAPCESALLWLFVALSAISLSSHQDGQSGDVDTPVPGYAGNPAVLLKPPSPQFEQSPATPEQPEKLLPQTEPGSPEHTFFEPIAAFLASPDLYYAVLDELPLANLTTNGQLLRGILLAITRHPATLQDPNLMYSTVTYSNLLETRARAAGQEPILLGQNSTKKGKRVKVPGYEGEAEVTLPELDEEDESGPRNVLYPETMIPEFPPNSPEGKFFEPLVDFLRIPDVYDTLLPGVNTEQNPSKGKLIRATLREMKNLQLVQQNPQLFYTVSTYLNHLEGNRFQPLHDVWFPPIDWDLWNTPALLPNELLPHKQESRKLLLLSSFLADPNLMKMIGFGFHPKSFKRGHILMSILREAVHSDWVHTNRELHDTITQYLTHVWASMATAPAHPNYGAVVFATLPTPRSVKEMKQLTTLTTCIEEAAEDAATFVKFRKDQTNGEVIKEILEFFSNNNTSTECATAATLFRDKVIPNFNSEQPVVTQVDTGSSLNIYKNLLLTIKTDSFNDNGFKQLATVFDYLKEQITPGVSGPVKDYPGFHYRTNWAFLRHLFLFLFNSGDVNDSIKAAIKYLFPYITKSAIGEAIIPLKR